MSENTMDDARIKELAAELAKGIKTEADLAALSRQLLKTTVETALNAEMEEHLGYEKHSPAGRNSGNSRNGFTSKVLTGDHGEVVIQTPRDRKGDFEPALVRKGQRRLTQFDDQILALYGRGMSTRDIVATFKEMYDADVSPSLISRVTDAVLDRVLEWQGRALDPLYPIVYLDCLVVKVRQDRKVINKSIFLALGINIDGEKELLGMWMGETEGAKFWMTVLTELQNRGLKDILIACVDGLTGFPKAIQTVFPKTKVQLCIIHMVRNSLRYVSWKDKKAVIKALKRIYRALNLEQAEQALDDFAETWDAKYPTISRSWRRDWEHLITLFDYPEEIRKIIYTTNAIESLNSVIRKAIKNRRIFPTDGSAMKVVYLACDAASRRWTRPLANWSRAMNRFAIDFEDRVKIN